MQFYVIKDYFRNWGQCPEDKTKGNFFTTKKLKRAPLIWPFPMLIASLQIFEKNKLSRIASGNLIQIEFVQQRFSINLTTKFLYFLNHYFQFSEQLVLEHSCWQINKYAILIFNVHDISAPKMDFRCMQRFVLAFVHLSLLSLPCVFLNVLDPTKTK